MKINPFYPICNEKPELVKEFFSGFFYLGRKKYVRLPSDPLELKVRQELNKSICAQNVLKIALYITGIVALVAAFYKAIEAFSLVGKNITLLINEKPQAPVKPLKAPLPGLKKVDEVAAPVVNPQTVIKPALNPKSSKSEEKKVEESSSKNNENPQPLKSIPPKLCDWILSLCQHLSQKRILNKEFWRILPSIAFT